MAIRSTPNTTSHPSGLNGSTNADLVNVEIVALWARAACWLDNIGGTADVITAEADVTLDAYARPNAFWLIPTSNNTGAVTINIDTLGAIDVVDKAGDALAADALVAGTLYLLVYDGSDFRVVI